MNNHSISTVTGKTRLKIIFLGNQNVGKTCIIDKYINDRFQQTANPTVGIDFLAKNISHKAKNYRLQLWDTAGQERFRSLIPGYLRDSHCALIVYDVSSKTSFADVESWIKLYNESKSSQGFIFLVGNKIDREYREVTQQQGLEKANKLGLPYFQISAKSGDNIEDLFTSIVEQHTDKSITNSKFLVDPRENIRARCVEVVKEEKQEQQLPKQAQKPNVEETGAKIVEQSTNAPPKVENIILKNEPQAAAVVANKKKCC